MTTRFSRRPAEAQLEAQIDAWAKTLGELLGVAIVNLGLVAVLCAGLNMAGVDFWPALLISLGIKGMTHHGSGDD